MIVQTTSSKSRSIFIIPIHAMFGYGLKALLQQQCDIDIVGFETDIDRALEQIKQVRPDVIILEIDQAPFSSPSAVLPRLLNEGLDTTIISLSLEDNKLLVYMTAQWLAQNTDDLMNAIRQELPAAVPTYSE